ncbi:hypothetical protein [Spirillospora sp. CA-128828]|uniref:hypothetical protein n=1 Tax=Spirillospora sp. CA-128828 TaxID=3240033 RepID=UPI003D92915F
MRTLRYLVQYTIADWAEADRIAGDFPQVVRLHEAARSAYALFVEVARGRGPPWTSGCASSPRCRQPE